MLNCIWLITLSQISQLREALTIISQSNGNKLLRRSVINQKFPWSRKPLHGLINYAAPIRPFI